MKPKRGDTHEDKPVVGASLPEGDARFRHLCDTAPVMIWTSGPDALCDFFNKPWLDFRGRTMEQEIGNGWAEGVHPDDYDRCLQIYLGSFDTREPFSMEYRLRRRDGIYRWVLDNGTPRYEADGTIMGYIGSCIDITDRKVVEEERAQLAAEMRDAASRQRAVLKEVMAAVTEDRLRLCEGASDLPAPLCPEGDSIPLTVPGLSLFRRRVRHLAEALGMPRERQQDLETAVGEAAMNAVVHAARAKGRICTNGMVQVWIEDNGPGIAPRDLPQAALKRGYSSIGSFGHGFHLILQTADRVYLLTGPQGTTVVLEQDSSPLASAWMRDGGG